MKSVDTEPWVSYIFTMRKQAQIILNGLREKGLKGEKLISSYIDVGLVLKDRAQKEANKDLDKVACDIFDDASVMAKDQGFKSLFHKANELAGQMKDLR